MDLHLITEEIYQNFIGSLDWIEISVKYMYITPFNLQWYPQFLLNKEVSLRDKKKKRLPQNTTWGICSNMTSLERWRDGHHWPKRVVLQYIIGLQSSKGESGRLRHPEWRLWDLTTRAKKPKNLSTLHCISWHSIDYRCHLYVTQTFDYTNLAELEQELGQILVQPKPHLHCKSPPK